VKIPLRQNRVPFSAKKINLKEPSDSKTMVSIEGRGDALGLVSFVVKESGSAEKTGEATDWG
jgi:hypothetical protein